MYNLSGERRGDSRIARNDIANLMNINLEGYPVRFCEIGLDSSTAKAVPLVRPDTCNLSLPKAKAPSFGMEL